MNRRSFVASTLAAAAGAQEAVFSTDVNVVNVLATVRNRDGRIVTDLAREDFQLEEQGRRQEIRYFTIQTDLPLSLGLLIDTSPSVARVLDQERKACRRFLGKVLRPDTDRAFVIQFNREVELVQDFTSSREELERAIDQLEGSRPVLNRRNDFQWPGGTPFPIPGGRSPFPIPGGGDRNPRTGGPNTGRARVTGTALYDAVLLASEELMLKQKGRKALILISDGVDAGSKVALTDAIEAAQRSDSLVYSIRFFDEDAYRRIQQRGRGLNLPDGKKTLERISEETGGAEFEQEKKLDEIFDLIEEELRNQYSLGYKPDRPASKGEYREIRLTTRKSGLKVQTRKGYYA